MFGFSRKKSSAIGGKQSALRVPLAARLADALFEEQADERFELANPVVHLFQICRFRFAAGGDPAMLQYA